MAATIPLVLGSASPRRLDLLAQLGLAPAAVIPAHIDETPQPRERPRTYVRRVAVAKAQALRDGGEARPILSADTVVAAGQRILPKAEDAATVRSCLSLLSGRRHRVYSAVALLLADGTLRERMTDTVVAFKRLSTSEIDRYVVGGEGLGKAGGYAIQGQAAAFVTFLAGSHSGVVGLPLAETWALLDGHGLLPKA